MWSMSQRSNQVWGLSGYEVPVLHLDHKKTAMDKNNWGYAVGKKKRQLGPVNDKAKKIGIFDDIKKKSQQTPAPWKYDLKNKWMTGYKKYPKVVVAPKDMQKLKAKWKKQAEFQIEKPPGPSKAKIDMKVQKKTYIDDIINKAKKKGYPTPGPATYFKDKTLLKKLDPEVAELVSMFERNEKKEKNLPQSERVLSLIEFPKENAMKPGPGKYDIPKKKYKEVHLSYTNYKNKIKGDKERRRENKERDRAAIEEKKDKIKVDPPKFPEPLPADYVTFSKYAHKYKGVKKGGPIQGNGFGSSKRFAASDNERWAKICETYNKADVTKTLNPKQDMTPGPAHYNVVHYKDKKAKRKPGDKFPNIFKHISKGPSISMYYRK